MSLKLHSVWKKVVTPVLRHFESLYLLFHVLEQQVQTLKCNLSLYVYALFANNAQAAMQLNACHTDCACMKETQVSVLL